MKQVKLFGINVSTPRSASLAEAEQAINRYLSEIHGTDIEAKAIIPALSDFDAIVVEIDIPACESCKRQFAPSKLYGGDCLDCLVKLCDPGQVVFTCGCVHTWYTSEDDDGFELPVKHDPVYCTDCDRHVRVLYAPQEASAAQEVSK